MFQWRNIVFVVWSLLFWAALISAIVLRQPLLLVLNLALVFLILAWAYWITRK